MRQGIDSVHNTVFKLDRAAYIFQKNRIYLNI